MACDDCCKRCCYSTPFGTLVGLIAIIVGVTGFVPSSIYGIVSLSETPQLQDHILFFAPIAGGIVVLTIFPVFFATLMAYCVTGYIRDELYAATVKNFIGKCCSFFGMFINFVFFVLWLLLLIALSVLLTVFIQLKLSCDETRDSDDGSFDELTCLPRGNYSVITRICGADLESLCASGENAGISFAVTLACTLLIIIGMVGMMMVQGANYVNARENMEYRRSYQPRTSNSNQEDYIMKRVQ